ELEVRAVDGELKLARSCSLVQHRSLDAPSGASSARSPTPVNFTPCCSCSGRSVVANICPAPTDRRPDALITAGAIGGKGYACEDSEPVAEEPMMPEGKSIPEAKSVPDGKATGMERPGTDSAKACEAAMAKSAASEATHVAKSTASEAAPMAKSAPHSGR